MNRKSNEFVYNALGRSVPTIINGEAHTSFQGINYFKPKGNKHKPKISSCTEYPSDGNKLVSNLKEALIRAGLCDGMTISTHHHFRDGDLLTFRIFQIAEEMGVKNLRWFPSASFPCHRELIPFMENGTIHHVEGSMNGPLGSYCSEGKMKGLGVLRSHGGRHQAVQDGEVQIDIAIIAAPSADTFGNCNGLEGKAACGSLGFASVDAQYADKVIVVTDNLVPFPCVPWQIQGNNVDFTVEVDVIGVSDEIISGTTKITKSPDRLLIAELTARFCEAAGLIRQGFSFQAGAGGTALAIGQYFSEIMKRKNIQAAFARGGSNRYLVKMLEEGLVKYILDGQTFDLDGVESLRKNINHVMTNPFTSYNFHGKGNFSSMVDIAILGATEVDLEFNGNVVTHSDGMLLHGIGGWQNCLFSKCTILPVPLFRNRLPVIRDKVTTLCGPGELIDVVVTERGIAINPLRQDLIDATQNSNLPIRSMESLLEEAYQICGVPDQIELSNEAVAVVKWVDGTVLDSIYKVE